MKDNVVEVPKFASVWNSMERWRLSSRINGLKLFGYHALCVVYSLHYAMPSLLMTHKLNIITGVLCAIVILIGILKFTIVSTIYINRLHALNLRGLWCLLALIPFIEAILGLIMHFWPGAKGKNRFGDLPIPASKRFFHILLSDALLVFIILCV